MSMRDKIAKAIAGRIRWNELPPDMQDIIGQFVEGSGRRKIMPAIPAEFPVVPVPVKSIPHVPLDEFDRGTQHARAMDLTQTPPILTSHGYFIDGKHRVFQARETGVPHLGAIDLTDIADPQTIRTNQMGRLLRNYGIVGGVPVGALAAQDQYGATP